ncbi:MAG: hypothetical protein ABIU58_02805 [Ramlibacter sp.]
MPAIELGVVLLRRGFNDGLVALGLLLSALAPPLVAALALLIR